MGNDEEFGDVEPVDQQAPQMSPVGINGAPPIRESVQVTDPVDGSPIPDDHKSTTSDDEFGPVEPIGPNTKALQFVAQHGALPTPDRAGQIIKYSAATGLPTNLVEADFDNIKKRVDTSNVNWDELAKKNPGLAQFMAADPAHIPLAVEDHKNLSLYEWFKNAPGAALWQAMHSQGTIALQSLQAEGADIPDEQIQKRLDKERALAESFGNEDFGANNAVTRTLIRTLKMLPYYALDEGSRYGGGLLGGLAGGAGGAEGGPAAVGTGLTGAAVGQFSGSMLLNYEQFLGPMYWTNMHTVDAQGRHMDPFVANATAQAGAITVAGLMAGVGPVGNKLAPGLIKYAQGAAPKMLEKLSQNVIAKWMLDDEVRGTIAKLAGRWGTHLATGAVVNAATSAVNAATNEAAKYESGLETSPMRILEEAGGGLKSGLQDMWMLAGVGAVRDHYAERGRQQMSADSQARLDGMLEAAKASTVLSKSPEAFKKYADLTDPNGKVYVPADRWVSYFQGKNLDPEKMAGSAGVKPEELQKAIDTGGNVEFKASDFITQFAQTEHAPGLAMDIKSEPGEDTKHQAQELAKSEAKRMMDEQKSRADELDSGKQRIENFLVDQAKASKLKVGPIRQASKILAEAVGKRAIEFNVAYNEAARMMNFGNLTLTGKDGATPEHEGILKSFNEWLDPGASQELKAKLESMSPENQARRVFIDTNTGLPNKAHFDDLNKLEGETAFPADERQYAHVGIAGTKFINDTLDHGKGDLLYRAAGKALHDAAPELNVSKPGGDFEFRVRDQAHLDEVLKKANENMPEQLKPFVLAGGVGKDAKAAKAEHIRLKQEAEKAGTRNPRVDENKKALPPKGFTGNAKDIVFPEEKVSREPHQDVAKQFGDLSKEAKFNKAFVEPKTGLLNNLAWKMLDHDSSYHYAALDVRDLGLANTKFGDEGGDTLVDGVGKVIAHYGGSSFDAAHLSGDEYALRHKDPYQLAKMLERVKEKLTDRFDAVLKDGEKVRVGVDFWHGLARGSYEAADRNLSERKGLAKGAEAAHVAPRAPGGNQDNGDAPGQIGTLVFRAPDGRGVSPQGYPGTSGRGFLNQEALAVREPPAPPQPVLDMQAFLGRMKIPERKAIGEKYLDYVTGRSDERPANVPKDIVDKFAEVGLVHPSDEAEFAARGISTRGDYKVPSKSGGVEKMPDELKRHHMDNLRWRTGEYEQGKKVVSNIEGAPVELTRPRPQPTKTETPEFKNWFGESRVLGQDGKPLVVYHGTASGGFDTFNRDLQNASGLKGPGFYFAEDPAHAGGYSEATRDNAPGDGGPAVYPAFLSIKSPLDEEAPAASFVSKLKEFKAKAPPAEIKRMIDSALRESPDNLSTEGIGAWIDNTQWAYKIADKLGKNGEEIVAAHEDYILSKARDYIVKQIQGREFWQGKDILNFIDKNVIIGSKEVQGALGLPQGDNGNIRHVLEKLGFDGLTHMDAVNEDQTPKRVWMAFEPEQIKSATGNRGTFDPNDPNILRQEQFLREEDEKGGEDPRGQIRFNISGGQAHGINIQLFKADASTFLHESAHFLGLALHDLAHSDLATPQIKADYDTLLKFMGYESADQRLKSLATGADKEKEEKLSHGFEQYVMEGKAPSSALARVFTRFKKWLTGIYQGVFGVQSTYEKRYGQKLELSDEVRQVFDRMLAQDEALRQADKSMGGTGEVKEAVAGMTPDQAASYREKLADSAATAGQKVAQSQGGAKLAKQRAEFEKQTKGEVDAQPVYRAWRYLEHGNAPQGDMHTGLLELVDDSGKPFKLGKAEFVKQYGQDAADKMPPNAFGKKGVSADSMASALGFNGGDDMVGALSRATPRDEAISRGTQDKMDAANGPELERLTEAALSGAHDDKALSAAVDELRGLAKKINPAIERKARSVDTEAIRANVERLTSGKAVGELDPGGYADTERRLAMQAAELWGKGEKEASYDKREQRLLNKVMFMSERDAKEELSAARDRIRNPSPGVRANLGKANPAYRDVHDSLIQALGLAPKLVPAETPKSLDEMLADADRDGHELGDWADTVRAILQKPVSWKSLTVDQARDVVDAVKNLRHVAREENEVTIAGETKDKKELQQALYNRTASVRPEVEKLAHGGKEPTLMQKVASKYRGASGSLQELETLADMLDGGSKGPWNDLLVRSFLGSRDREVELIKSSLAPIKEAFEKIPKELLKLRDQSVDVANLLPPPKDTPAGYTRSYLWNIFLNLGNEGNIQRLVDGNKYTYENMIAAVSKLSEPELDFLQRVRDVANKQLFPELAKAYEARTGLPLGKVAATPITINGKTYEGGYWPIRYDRDYEGNQGQRQEINDMKDLLPRVGTPTVTNSATKSRLEKVFAPLDLTWSTVPQHFATVIHDIAYGDTIRQVGKVLIKPRIPDENLPSANKTASDFIGKERSAEILPALRDIAADRIDSTAGHVTALVKGTSFMRSRLTAATLMVNLPSLARHLTDPLVAAVDTEGVPLHHIAAAYLKVMNPASWGEFEPFKQASELEYHRVRHEENLRQELGRMGNAEGRMERAMRVGFKLQSWMDAFVSRVAFRGAYDHAKASGLDESAAIQRGNDVVRRTMPSGNIAEKAPILRTKQGWASCILFYGYASKIHNVRSRAFDRLYRAWNAESLPDLDSSAPDQGTRSGAVVDVAAKMIGLGLISALGGYLAGRGPTKDEDDKRGVARSRAEWLATETMLSPMDDAPPVVGPAIKATLLGHKTNIGSAPELMLLDHQLEKLGNLVHGKKKEDEDATWNMVANMVGLLLGPAGQAQKTIPFVGKASEGREHVRGPLDFGAGVFYGDKKHQGANPLTDAQSLMSGRR